MENVLLQSLRTNMKKAGIDAYYFNTQDYHLSEWVAEYFKTIRSFSGFSGSTATLIVDEQKATIFVDGRYHLQAEKECTPFGVDVVKLGTAGAPTPLEFIGQHYVGKTMGLDGKRSSIRFCKGVEDNKVRIKDIDIYSELLENREALKEDELYEIDTQYVGKSRKEKLEELKYCYEGKVHVINNLECIAYLLNLRANDIPHTPVFMSYLVVYKNDVYFFIDLKRLSADLLEKLYLDGIIIRPYNAYYDLLKEMKNEMVFLDEDKVNYASLDALKNHFNKVVDMRSIAEDMKAVKNDVEIANTIKAHIKDGVAMVKFIKWLKEIDKRTITEMDAMNYVDNCRKEVGAFDISFGSIVAYNENAAQMHYAPSIRRPVILDNKGILLVDSGGQYKEGTTDITRTISLGETSKELKKHFTLVLRSMLNLGSAKFLEGMNGASLDILARINIWKEGLDYRCGTGHGIGHILSVHENPPRITYAKANQKGVNLEALKPGMISSDEPGIYLDGQYGIRSENEILVQKDVCNEYGQFLSFKYITYCPFDLDLVDKEYLDKDAIDQLNAYHKEVFETLSPYLNEEEKAFLAKETRSI